MSASARERNRVKREIARMFRERVRGRRYQDECKRQRLSEARSADDDGDDGDGDGDDDEGTRRTSTHCGAEGHWLEARFGIRPNSRKEADYKGFELKADSSKVSVGDWTRYAQYCA